MNFPELGDLERSGIIALGRGKIISKKDILNFPGSFPVYSSAQENNGKLGEYGQYMFDDEMVTWSIDGGGQPFYRSKHKFSITNVGGFVRVLDKSKLNVKYLYYLLLFLHSAIKFDWVKKAHPSVLRKAYRDIMVPPLPEQHRIVAILDEAFAGIAVARGNVERCHHEAHSLLSAVARASLDSYGKAFTSASLGEVCELYQPQTISGKDLVEGGAFRVYGANGPIGFYDRFNHEEAQLMITCRGATCGTINRSEPKSWITGNSMVVRPRDGVALDLEYLEWMLRYETDLSSAITGSAQPQITRTNLAPVRVRFPSSLSDQQRAVVELTRVREHVEQLQSLYTRKLAALDELKQSLLQQAFSGRL